MPTSKAPPAPPKPASPTAAAGGGDKVRFTCSACGFKARIPSSYAGENIHCPSCNAVQLVLRSGQLSPNATGNTQIIQVVQTAAAAGSPDAIATPTHTPAHGLPVISDEPAKPPVAKPAAPAKSTPPIAKPAVPPPSAPGMSKPITPITPPPPAIPVAQPAGTAKAEATIDDLLNFEDQPPEEPKPAGKVVRRGSDRLNVVGATKTPLPEPAKPTTLKTPLPEPVKPVAMTKPAEPIAAPAPSIDPLNAEIDEDPPSDPLPAKPAAKGPAKPAVKTDRTAKPVPSRPEPKVTMSESAPAKQSNALVIVIAVIGLGLLGGLGFLVKLQMDNATQMAQMNSELSQVRTDLKKANDQLGETNAKLSKAEEDTKLAKEAADLAAKKQAEEAAARKVSEAKAAELEAKLKAAEEAAAKAAAEKPAPVTTPPAVETPK
jgi:hypothetical protein